MKQSEHTFRAPVLRLLIPAEPRQFTGQRWVRITARAVHVVVAGVCLGAFVFHVEQAFRWPWLLAALLSGVVMLCVDLYESGAFLLQVHGLVVAVKLVLLALLPMFGAAQVWVLAVVAFASVISSHAPSSFRHYLVWGWGPVRAPKSKG